VLLKEIICPNCARTDDASTGRVRDRDQDAVRDVADAAGGAARYIDDREDPAAGQTIVSDLRVAGEVHWRARHHRGEKEVWIGVDHAVSRPGGFVESSQTPVYKNEKLRGANRAH